MAVSQPSSKKVHTDMIALASSQVEDDPYSLINIEEVLDGLGGLDSPSGGEIDSCLYRVLKKFNETLDRKNIEHSFRSSELTAWIAIEIMNTGVDLSDIAPWLCHEATLDEIVFGEDSASLLSLFVSRKDKNNRRKFRAMLRSKGLSRRCSHPKSQKPQIR